VGRRSHQSKAGGSRTRTAELTTYAHRISLRPKAHYLQRFDGKVAAGNLRPLLIASRERREYLPHPFHARDVLPRVVIPTAGAGREREAIAGVGLARARTAQVDHGGEALLLGAGGGGAPAPSKGVGDGTIEER
jgi:hypothetical protein